MYFESLAYYTGYGTTFQFLVDDEPLDNKTLEFGNWTTHGYVLPFGTHKLSFVYHSANALSTNITVEGARLSYIEILGITYETTTCIPCAPGHGGYDGRCYYCYMNEYSDSYGSNGCQACSADQYALPGATRCEPKVPCEAQDYHVRHSACSNGKTTKTYYLYNPIICNNSVLPPGIVNNTEEDCAPCNPGTYHNGTNATCAACPTGTYRQNLNDSDVCMLCPNGTTAFKTLYIKTLYTNTLDDPNRDFFTTRCYRYGITTMDCTSGGNGWNTTNNAITSGNYYLGAVTSSLFAHVNGSYGSSIEFSFKLHLQPGSLFTFYEGTNSNPVQYNSTQNNVWINHTQSYNSDMFTWVFHKHQKRGFSLDTGLKISDYVELDYIIFHDVPGATGGGTSCRKCPNGTVSNAGDATCTQCPVGTFAVSGDPTCAPCINNTYGQSVGLAECLPCGEQSIAGFYSNSTTNYSTTCFVASCGLSYNDSHVFDLSPLTLSPDGDNADPELVNETMYGPIEIPYYVAGTFYIGVCSSVGSERYCVDNTMFCEVSGAQHYNVGNKTNLTFFENPETGDYGINMTFFDGTYYYYSNYSGPRAAEVLFVCTPGAGVGKPVKNKTIDFLTQPHTYHFRWESDYACRLCTSDDYEPFVTECVASKKITQYVLKVGARCFGGVVSPPDTSIGCTMPAVTLNGGGLALIIVGSIVVIAIIVIVLIILIRKNRKLRYQLVQKESFKTGGVQAGQAGLESMVSFSTNKN